MPGEIDLTIVICDDERYVHEEVETLVEKYCGMNNMLCNVIHFFSPKQLFSVDVCPDCLFLDLNMPDMDGIEVARKLNRYGVNYKIVVLTCKEERFKEAFEINAFRFVTKPINEREFFKAIDDVMNCLIGLEEVDVYRDYHIYNIKQKEILYIIAGNSETIIYTIDNDYRSENSLKQWNKRLDDRLFFQCHRSYIVNVSVIEDIETGKVLLVSGDKIEVSRRKVKVLKQKYLHYIMKYK